MFTIQRYMNELIPALNEEFGMRLLYVGLQGSYRRGEADSSSDIDVMVVLDQLHPEDLDQYRKVVSSLEAYERSCGFICGKAELLNWNPLEICQLVHETQDWFGQLAPLVPSYCKEDVQNHVKCMAGNLYHAICHASIHAPEDTRMEQLKASYKTVFYILQNWTYCKTDRFILTKQELLRELRGMDYEVLSTAIALRAGKEMDYEKAFHLLFDWCQQLLQTI